MHILKRVRNGLETVTELRRKRHLRKRKVGGHEIVPTPAKKVKLNAKRVAKGKACKENASAPSSGEDTAVTAETWKMTRKHAAMDVMIRNLEKAKAQPTA